MVSGLFIWYWITNCCAFCGKDYFSHSHCFLFVFNFLSRISLLKHFPFMSAHLLMLSIFRSYLRNHVCVASEIPRIHSLLANSPFVCCCQSFCPSSVMILETLVEDVCCIYIPVTGIHNSVFSLVVVSCNGLFLLQREVSLTSIENYTFLCV